MRYLILMGLFLVSFQFSKAQINFNWTSDGLAYTKFIDGNIVRTDPRKDDQVIICKKEQLTPNGSAVALIPQSYSFSSDNSKLLLLFHTSARLLKKQSYFMISYILYMN